MSAVVPLPGAVVVVTGASSGIGRTTALAFARAGSTVVLAARRRERLTGLAEQIQGHGGHALAVACDVTSWESMQSLADEVKREFGRCDVLINNAGIPGGGTFDELSVERLRLVLDTNLLGTVHGVKAFLPMMLEAGRGHIVNLASLAGRHAVPKAAIYSASKHGVVALSESLDYEFQDRNIRVTAVNPAFVATEGFPQDDRPAKLVMKPETIADVIVDVVRRGRAPQVSVPRWVGALEIFRLTVPNLYRWAMKAVLAKRHHPTMVHPPEV